MVGLIRTILLFGLVWSSCVLADTENNTIIIMTPYIWTCDQYTTQTLLVDIVSPDRQTQTFSLNVTLTSRSSSSESTSVLKTVSPNSNGFHRVDIKLPVAMVEGQYDLNISAKNANGYSFFGSLRGIECRNNQDGLYIITDKPIYRESEKVKMRIVSVDLDLLPVNGKNTSIFIMDPNQNRVQQYLNRNFDTGLIEDLEFQLSERPIYGTWEIKVVADKTEKSAFFTVKEYVLPKFEVKVDLPEYMLKSSKSIKGSVSAKYTYGKPLDDGNVTIEVSSDYYNSEKMRTEKISKVTEFALTKGKLDFEIPFLFNDNFYGYKINVTVTDNQSLENITVEQSLNVYWTEFYARLNSYNFNTSKTNNIQIDLVRQSGKPFALQTVDLMIIQRFMYYQIARTLNLTLTSDANGRLNFNIDVPENITNIEITITLQTDQTQKGYAYLYKYVENPYTTQPEVPKLSIVRDVADTDTADLKIDSTLALKLIRKDPNSTVKCVIVKYIALGKLRIFVNSYVEVCDVNTIYLPLNADYAPYSSLIAYYVDPVSKNVSVANYEINIANYFRNNLEISFAKNVTEPGKDVEITLKSKENSRVSLCIIDKSVELMGATNELNEDLIASQLAAYRLYSYYPPSPDHNNGGGDVMPFARKMWMGGHWETTASLRNLQNQGLAVASDLDDLSSEYVHSSIYPAMGKPHEKMNMAADAAERPAAGGAVEAMAKAPVSKEDVKVRSVFKDIWIWQTVDLGNTTQKSIISQIPDTITSWVASGFSLNQEFGIAIANKSTITSFKPFFVTSNLPASLIRGERLVLISTVFNYLDTNLTNVHVYLSKTDDFKQTSADGKTSSDISQDLEVVIPKIEAQSAESVQFIITPTRIGQLPITIKAVSDVAGDGETKKLKVKPEGVQQSNTQALLIEVSDNNPITHDFLIDLPDNIVNDSAYCSVQVIGDLLGPSLNNLNRLVTKPYGCGEQNMITLVPNIYLLDYLNSIGGGDENDASKANLRKFMIDAKSNILSGYQNQLRYRLDDGSFSAFGQSDVNGSTWLTAFVAKSFAAAQKYAPEIESRVIEKACDFLVSRQSESGAFTELGRVIHRDMQGGVESEQTITAYVTVALVESKLAEKSTKIDTVVKKALAYLEKQASSVKDTYSLGLITYALNVGKSDQAKAYFDKFQAKAQKKPDGGMYWSKSEQTSTTTTELASTSSDIELTSFGLILNVFRNDFSSALSIVRYLVGKSSSLGGYTNTQDTVLALQALSAFGAATKSDSSGGSQSDSITATVSLNDASGSQTAQKSFTTNDENSMVLQTWDLPKCEKKVRLSASGRGKSLIQIVVNYNLPKTAPAPMFKLSQTASKPLSGASVLNVRTCTTYNKESSPTKADSTGMTIIEATLLSGYEADKQDLERLVADKQVKYLKLAEIKDQNVVFYLDQLDDGKELCIEWKMYKKIQVENLQDVPLKVYDYYQSSLSFETLYKPDF